MESKKTGVVDEAMREIEGLQNIHDDDARASIRSVLVDLAAGARLAALAEVRTALLSIEDERAGDAAIDVVDALSVPT